MDKAREEELKRRFEEAGESDDPHAFMKAVVDMKLTPPWEIIEEDLKKGLLFCRMTWDVGVNLPPGTERSQWLEAVVPFMTHVYEASRHLEVHFVPEPDSKEVH